MIFILDEFKPIPGYDNYQVSRSGIVMNVKTGRILKPGPHPMGYLQVNLSRRGITKAYRIHRLVAELFVANPDNLPDVRHDDGDKHKNHYTNLTWIPEGVRR